MRCVIVPNELRDAIHKKIDEAAVGLPPAFEENREAIYQTVLEYYDEHGVIPDFKLQAAPASGQDSGRKET